MKSKTQQFLKQVRLENGNLVRIDFAAVDSGDVTALENVTCESTSGEILWRINTQGAHFADTPNMDAFVDLSLTSEGVLYAYTYNGFQYKVDKETGLSVCIAFLK